MIAIVVASIILNIPFFNMIRTAAVEIRRAIVNLIITMFLRRKWASDVAAVILIVLNLFHFLCMRRLLMVTVPSIIAITFVIFRFTFVFSLENMKNKQKSDCEA